jgi:hypothetical protein
LITRRIGIHFFQNSDDDEATIAKEEDDHEDDELDLLKAESDIPVEELLRLYHPGNFFLRLP